MCNISNYDIATIIDGLNDAIRVCYEVDSISDDCERSYPYATGYSRSAMQTAVESLMHVMKSKSEYELDCV